MQKIQNYGITGYGTMSSDWGTEVAVCLHLSIACEDIQQAPQNHS
jgi:hypothetical protein